MSELISDKKLEELIKERFGIKEDLNDFCIDSNQDSYDGANLRFFGLKRKNSSLDRIDGYFFISFNESIENSVESILYNFVDVFSKVGNDIKRYFIDYENRVGGFFWRRQNG